MAEQVEFLASFDTKEEARAYRDQILETIQVLRFNPDVKVGIRLIKGVGGYAVEIHRQV